MGGGREKGNESVIVQVIELEKEMGEGAEQSTLFCAEEFNIS
jgi:hypothetical protein